MEPREIKGLEMSRAISKSRMCFLARSTFDRIKASLSLGGNEMECQPQPY
jgi:hypothetical protein